MLLRFTKIVGPLALGVLLGFGVLKWLPKEAVQAKAAHSVFRTHSANASGIPLQKIAFDMAVPEAHASTCNDSEFIKANTPTRFDCKKGRRVGRYKSSSACEKANQTGDGLACKKIKKKYILYVDDQSTCEDFFS